MDASCVASLEIQLSARLDEFLAGRQIALMEGLREVVIAIVDAAMVEVSNFLLDKAVGWLISPAFGASRSEEARAFKERCIISITMSLRKFLEKCGLLKDGSSAIQFVDSTLNVGNRFKRMLAGTRAKAGQHGMHPIVASRTRQPVAL